MNTPLVSVIVPVYKAEAYLHKCVDSLLAQTMTDFEVLLIDDGSPDRSGAICDEYAAKDSRIRVFHKENGGVASARQVGIENVRGEYTIHADPDDWVEPTMLEELYAKAKEDDADMVICDYYENTQKGQFYRTQKIEKFDSDNCLYAMLYGTIANCVWNKLVRTSIFFDKIKFEKGFDLGEDQLFNFRLFNKNKLKIFYLARAFYHYEMSVNENSYTATYSVEKEGKNKLKLFELYRKELKETSLYEKIKELILFDEMSIHFLLGDITSLSFKNKYKDYFYIVNDKKCSLFFKILLLFSCFGFYKFSKCIYNIKNSIKSKIKL